MPAQLGGKHSSGYEGIRIFSPRRIDDCPGLAPPRWAFDLPATHFETSISHWGRTTLGCCPRIARGTTRYLSEISGRGRVRPLHFAGRSGTNTHDRTGNK